jgi:hypothetical protein
MTHLTNLTEHELSDTYGGIFLLAVGVAAAVYGIYLFEPF